MSPKPREGKLNIQYEFQVEKSKNGHYFTLGNRLSIPINPPIGSIMVERNCHYKKNSNENDGKNNNGFEVDMFRVFLRNEKGEGIVSTRLPVKEYSSLIRKLLKSKEVIHDKPSISEYKKV